ncbi:MAG: Gfo/Idh/MocA family protein, partial [Planctomycetota bacterium]
MARRKSKSRSNEPIRVGLVGIGRAGWGMHTGELAPREDKFRIVAACDVEKSRCDRMAERYDCATYGSIEDLVKDPDVELVDIASRSPEHVEHAITALAAGKVVFLEKPIALDIDGAKRLRTAVRRRKADDRIFFRHNRRFEPAFQHIREIIDSGVLGDVYQIKLRRHNYQRRADWQTRIDCGGGQLLNWGPHIIDHALRFLDSPVADQWTDLQLVAALGDAEDHVHVNLRGENGRVVELEISGGVAIPEPTYLVYGSRGALTSDEQTIRLRYLDPKQKLKPGRAEKASPPMEGGFGNPEPLKWIEKEIPVAPKKQVEMTMIWDHLYDAVRKGKPFPITFDEAYGVIEVISRAKAQAGFTTPGR